MTPLDLFRSAANSIPVVGQFVDAALDVVLLIHDEAEAQERLARRAAMMRARDAADAIAEARFPDAPDTLPGTRP